MRTAILFLFLSINLLNSSWSQGGTTEFGIKGGLNFTFFKVEQGDFGNEVESESGVYGGLFVDIGVDDFLSIQPEVLYIAIDEFRFVNVPIYAKYKVTKNMYLMVGPSMNYFLDLFNRKFKIRGDLSASYNLFPTLDIHIKYTLGFEIISPNGLFIGMGYRF